MTIILTCDACGEPIDQGTAYYEVTETKMKWSGLNDPTTGNVQETLLIPATFHYHDGHQPVATEAPVVEDYKGDPDKEPKEPKELPESGA